MKALIFDAHLGVTGGAQRVTGLLAAALGADADITIASPERFEPARFRDLYGVETPPCRAVAVGNEVAEISALTKAFDLFIGNQVPWVPPQARRNLLYIHFPLHSAFRTLAGIPTPLRAPDFYGARYDRILVNSNFTQEWVQKRWGLGSDVAYVYPSLSGGAWDPARKKPVILSVSRFQREKAQDLVLEAFLALEAPGWELVLAGHPHDRAYVEELRARAAGAAVRFVLDPDVPALIDLYREASIFWHLRGLEIPNPPEGLEHFGLVVVEAMSHGAIPVVFNGGGHPEIVTVGSGFLVSDRRELAMTTRVLIDSEPARRAAAAAAVARAAWFSKERFDGAVRAAVG